MPDFRGGGGAVQQLAQLGGVGQQAQPQVPGLLQMAQAAMDGGGAAGGSMSSFSANDIPFGAEVRPITSPEDQNWSDAQGRPIHVGGSAPAYQSGTTMGGFNSIFDRRAPSSTGGYFTMKDYLAGNPDPEGARTHGWTPGSENSPSTNNWRLLGNDPDLFMINGQVIDRRLLQYMFTPQSVMADEGVNPPGMNPAGPSGSGIWARRMGSYGGTMGYPGNAGWPVVATPTY